MLATARVNMYLASKDETYLTKPHMKMIRGNEWNVQWEPDYSVPEMAQYLLTKVGK